MLIAGNRGFMNFIELLFAVALLSILFYFAFIRRPVQDRGIQDMMEEAGINASSAQTLLDSTKRSIKGIENQMMERESAIFKQIEEC